MSTEPIAQAIAALHRVELGGSYHRAARARRIAVPQIDLTALEPVEEALCELSPAEAELLTAVLEDLAERREAVAAATPGPERVFPTDGYSRALLM